MSICNVDHCPNRAVRRGRCEQHAREQGKAKSQRRGFNAHRAGYDAKWERTRKRVLRARPICEDCQRVPSVDVHHLDELGPSGPHGHDDRNLRALCKPCHSRTTRASQLT